MMWNGQITLHASSQAEMDKRIADNEKRGFTLVNRSDGFNGWNDKRFTAVMRKDGYGDEQNLQGNHS